MVTFPMKLLLQACLLGSLALAACGCALAHPPLAIAEQARKSVVSLQYLGLDGNLHRYCTAVAVGPNTIWTAKHCWKPDEYIFLSDGYCPTNKVVADDGIDGVLVNTPCDTWKHYAKVGKAPEVMQDIFLFGNVRGLPTLYRTGYVSGKVGLPEDVALSWPLPKGLPTYLYSMNTGPGDSGAGVFNFKGEVVCVHSFGFGIDARWRIGGCFAPTFTEAQWKEIR